MKYEEFVFFIMCQPFLFSLGFSGHFLLIIPKGSELGTTMS